MEKKSVFWIMLMSFSLFAVACSSDDTPDVVTPDGGVTSG